MTDTAHAYRWKGINKEGHRAEGSIHAPDARNAQLELKKQGIEIVSLTEKHEFHLSSSRKKKVKVKDVLLFTRFLSTMLSAGLPILQALDVISRDEDNETMHAIVVSIRTNIAGGKTLAESFREHPECFSNLYCSLISTGEQSGTLDKILKRLATYLERSEALRKKIKKALVYPIAIIVIAIIVSLILLLFVVPQFQSMFKSFGAALPYFTQMIVNLSAFVRGYWWLMLVIVWGAIWGIRRSLRESKTFSEKVDHWVLHIPVIGSLLKKGIIARFTRTLSITLDAGMPITESMKSLANIMGNSVYSKAILKISNDVVSGNQLNAAMAATKLFPNMVIQMVSIGETSGSLADMLNKIADYYEDEVNNIADNLSNLLEPLIMAVLGVIIGGFVIAMYLPIFKIGSLF